MSAMDDRRTPSQTIGPFFYDGLKWATTNRPAARMQDDWLVTGRVVDVAGVGVSDAMLEIWMPDRTGRDDGSTDTEGRSSRVPGFQRVYTDENGNFTFVLTRRSGEATVAHVTVFARGLLNLLRTRLYLGTTADRLRGLDELRNVPPERLKTLLPSAANESERSVEWSVHLQGSDETVFFEFAP